MHATELLSLRTEYRGTQSWLINLEPENAGRFHDNGELIFGWVIRRIRDHRTPAKCFRSLDFVYIASATDADPKHIAGSSKYSVFKKALSGQG